MLFMGISLSSMKLHKLNTRMGTETDEDDNVVIVIYVTNMMVITKKMLLKVMLFMDISQPLFLEVSYFEYKNGNRN